MCENQIGNLRGDLYGDMPLTTSFDDAYGITELYIAVYIKRWNIFLRNTHANVYTANTNTG